MLDLTVVKTRLATKTRFSVEFATEDNVILQALSALPALYLGYLGERPTSEISPFNERSIEGIAGYDEEWMEMISISIITTTENVIQHKEVVKSAILGWSPNPSDQTSTFTSLGGTVLALNNGRVHYTQDFAITYPTF